MSVGLPVDKNILDSRAGNLVWQLRQAFADVQTVKTWLDGKQDSDLLAAPFNYLQAEINTLRAAYTDLSNLGKIANAQGTQAEANDFFFNAKKLTGLQ